MKRIALSILVILVISLTACNALSGGTSTSATQTNNQLTAQQLVVGTLKLEGTDQEVTVEQARELVTFWYVYDEISQSKSAAQEEVDGLVDQIQGSMTTEQLQAISDMHFTQQDVSAATQEFSTSSSSSNSQSNNSGTNSVSVPSGDMAGGAPTGGGMPSDSVVMDQITDGTGQSKDTQTGTNMGSSEGVSALVKALIQSLEQKLV